MSGNYTYLMHHGIKGQEWGVQNGPPYPLNPVKDYSPAEKKAQEHEYRLIKETENTLNNALFGSYRMAKEYSKKSKMIQERSKELNNLAEKVQDLDLKIEDYSIDKSSKEYYKLYDDALKKSVELAKKDKDYGINDKIDSRLIDYYMYDKNILNKTVNDFYKNDPSYKQLKKDRKEAILQYKNECGKITDEIIGEFGNIETSKLYDENFKYKEIVYYALTQPQAMWMFNDDENLGRK